MKKFVHLLIPVAVLFGCGQNKPLQSGVSGDAAFQKLSDDNITGCLAWRPANRVALGYHQYDGKVTDMSKESPGKELAKRCNVKSSLF